MKIAGKIIIAGMAGTTFMTIYSYYRAKKEHQEYVEPTLMNKLIDNSDNLPEIKNKETNPIGWVLHYATGVTFMAGYYLLSKKALERPIAYKIIVIGVASGVVGVFIWETLFNQHKKPPYNNRTGYYKQLIIAHIVFALTGVGAYKLLSKILPKK